MAIAHNVRRTSSLICMRKKNHLGKFVLTAAKCSPDYMMVAARAVVLKYHAHRYAAIVNQLCLRIQRGAANTAPHVKKTFSCVPLVRQLHPKWCALDAGRAAGKVVA